jgi:hypothetical protein
MSPTFRLPRRPVAGLARIAAGDNPRLRSVSRLLVPPLPTKRE